MKIVQRSNYIVFFDNIRVDQYILSLNTYLGLGMEEAGGSVVMLRTPELSEWKAYLTQIRIFAKNIFSQKYTMIFEGEITSISFDDRRSHSGNIVFQFSGFYHWLVTPLAMNVANDEALKAYQNFLYQAQGINATEMINLFHTEAEDKLAGKNIREIIDTLNTDVYRTTFQADDSNFTFVDFTNKFRIFDDVDEVFRGSKFINFFALIRSSRVGTYYGYLTQFLSELMFEFYQDRDGMFVVKNPGWTEPILKNHIIDESLIKGMTGGKAWVNEPTRVLAIGGTTAYFDQVIFNNPQSGEITRLDEVPHAVFIGTGQSPLDRIVTGRDSNNSGLSASDEEALIDAIEVNTLEGNWVDNVSRNYENARGPRGSKWPQSGTPATQFSYPNRRPDNNGGYFVPTNPKYSHNGIDFGGVFNVHSQGGKGTLYWVQDPRYKGGSNGKSGNGEDIIWGGWGVAVIVKQTYSDGDYYFIYAHLQKNNSTTLSLHQQWKSSNSPIEILPGQLLGVSGQTGMVRGKNPDHLHFEIEKDQAQTSMNAFELPGKAYALTPQDPYRFFQEKRPVVVSNKQTDQVVKLGTNQSYKQYLNGLLTRNNFLKPIAQFMRTNLTDMKKACDSNQVEYVLGIPYLLLRWQSKFASSQKTIHTDQYVLGTLKEAPIKKDGRIYLDNGGNGKDAEKFMQETFGNSFDFQTNTNISTGVINAITTFDSGMPEFFKTFNSNTKFFESRDTKFTTAIVANENRFTAQVLPFQIASNPTADFNTLMEASRNRDKTSQDKATLEREIRSGSIVFFDLYQKIAVCLLNEAKTIYTPFNNKTGNTVNQNTTPSSTTSQYETPAEETKATYTNVSYRHEDALKFVFSANNEDWITETEKAIQTAYTNPAVAKKINRNLVSAIIEVVNPDLEANSLKSDTMHIGLMGIPLEYLETTENDITTTDELWYQRGNNVLLGATYIARLIEDYNLKVTHALMAYYIGEKPGPEPNGKFVKDAIDRYAESNPNEENLTQKKNFFGNIVNELKENIMPDKYVSSTGDSYDISARKQQIEGFVLNVVNKFLETYEKDYILGDPHTTEIFGNFGANVYAPSTINTGGDMRLSDEEKMYKLNLKIVEKSLIRYDLNSPGGGALELQTNFDVDQINTLISKYAEYMMLVYRGQANSMTIQLTTCMPFLRPGMNVWIEPSRTNLVGYITGVSHEGSFQGGMTTTLRVEFLRDSSTYNQNFKENLFLGRVGETLLSVSASSQFGSTISTGEMPGIKKKLEDMHDSPDEFVDDAYLNSVLTELYASSGGAGVDLYGTPLSAWNKEYDYDDLQAEINQVYSKAKSMVQKRIAKAKTAFANSTNYLEKKLFLDDTK